MPHSLLEHAPEVEAYVSELTRGLGRMPAEERAEIHEEIRQHLEALVAAHVEAGTPHAEAVGAALTSFGAPRKLGRRLRREWLLGRRDPQAASLSEASLGFLVAAVAGLALAMLGCLPAATVALCLVALFIGVILERRRSGLGLFGVLLAPLPILTAVFYGLGTSEGVRMLDQLTLGAALLLLSGVTGAYLAGSARRGRLLYRYPIENLRMPLNRR